MSSDGTATPGSEPQRARDVEVLLADITTLRVDAIVNAANPTLAGGGGVDGAIHRAAGHELVAESRRMAPCPRGGAVITPGFALPARYVIHAVGPVWEGGNSGEADVLRKTYERAFELARAQGDIRSIAFPAISTGVYQFPKPLAARIAIDVMRRHVDEFDRVVACMFDKDGVDLYNSMMRVIELRDVTASDLPILYEQQLNPDATRMAAFPSRDWPAFQAHWSAILANVDLIKQTVVVDGQVAGYMAIFGSPGEREVGFWLDKAFWGQGVATTALRKLLRIETERPLFAHVIAHNIGSLRVLERCGFVTAGERRAAAATGGEEDTEIILRLDQSDAS